MKIIIKIILVVFYCLYIPKIYCQTESPFSPFNNAIKALENQNFQEAINLFERVDLHNISNTEQASIYYFWGISHLGLNNYSEADQLFQKSLTLCDGNFEIRCLNIIGMLEVSLHEKDNQSSAKHASQIETILKSKGINEQTIDLIPPIFNYYKSIGDTQSPLKIEQELSHIIINPGKMTPKGVQSFKINMTSIYTYLGVLYYENKEYEKAITHLKNAVKTIIPMIESNRHTIYSYIGNSYLALGDNRKALHYLKNAIIFFQKYKTNSIKDIIFYAKNLFAYGEILRIKGQYRDAIAYLEQAQKIFLKNEYYSDAVINSAYLYTCYFHTGNFEGKKECENLIIKYLEEVHEPDIVSAYEYERYLVCYSTYCEILNKNGNYQKSLENLFKLLKMQKKLFGDDQSQLRMTYLDIASSYYILQDYNKAKEYLNKALDCIKKDKRFYGDKIRASLLLADVEKKLGNIGRAIEMTEYLDSLLYNRHYIDEMVLSEYNLSLNDFYNEIGYSKQLINKESNNDRNEKLLVGDSSIDYANSLKTLSSYYYMNGMIEKSLKTIEKALPIYKKYKTDKYQYYHFLSVYTYLVLDNGYTEKADSLSNECLALSKQIWGDKSYEYAESLLLCAKIALKKNGHIYNKKDVELYKQGLSLLKELGKDNDENYLTKLRYLASLSLKNEDFGELYFIEKEIYQKVKSYVKRNFLNLIEWQRGTLSKSMQVYIEQSAILGAVVTGSNNYAKLAYNYALLNKGLSFYSTNNLKKVIQKSNDKDLLSLHNSIERKKHRLLRTTNKYSLQTLEKEIFSDQRKELGIVKDKGVFMSYLDIDWIDVRNSLKDNEAAIEFVSYISHGITHYYALLLTPLSYEPMVIPICTSDQLSSYEILSDEGYDYNNVSLYNLVWKNIENTLQGRCNTIYFAPKGLFHKLSIENLRSRDGSYASDKWTLFRLTSTRQLVEHENKKKSNEVVLFGGLTYDLSYNDLVAESRKYVKGLRTIGKASHDIVDRAKIRYLPGTYIEVKSISSYLKSIGIPCTVFSGKNGTEECIHSLSGKEINILHLATHGFYLKGSNNLDKIDFLTHVNDMRSFENEGLLKTGLLLSGSNCVFGRKELPNDVEDGILTAHEVSLIDLSNTDLVVLSACKTGIGEIEPEGVYGLQRGFKQAGSNSILMSLWNIDDKATALFMLEFYKNYFKGRTKVLSLKKAQQFLRSTSQYDSPKYWAGFVLLDGN